MNVRERKLEAIKDLIVSRSETYLKFVRFTKKTMAEMIRGNTVYEADDYLQEIFTDLIDETRAWDIDTYSIDQILFLLIKSKVSNEAKKSARMKTLDKESGEGDFTYTEEAENWAAPPEDIEGEIDAVRIRDYFLSFFEYDETGYVVLLEMINGSKQKDIANYLRISDDEAKVEIARVRRIIKRSASISYLANIPLTILNKIFKIWEKNKWGIYEYWEIKSANRYLYKWW